MGFLTDRGQSEIVYADCPGAIGANLLRRLHSHVHLHVDHRAQVPEQPRRHPVVSPPHRILLHVRDDRLCNVLQRRDEHRVRVRHLVATLVCPALRGLPREADGLQAQRHHQARIRSSSSSSSSSNSCSCSSSSCSSSSSSSYGGSGG